MQDGQPLMTFGNMGGAVQPETHAQHMVNVIDHGMNVQMTTDAARFTHSQSSNILSLEHDLYSLVGRSLEAKGHEVRSVNGGRVGGYQGILFTRDPSLPLPEMTRKASARTTRSTAFTGPDRITVKMVRRLAGSVLASGQIRQVY